MTCFRHTIGQTPLHSQLAALGRRRVSISKKRSEVGDDAERFLFGPNTFYLPAAVCCHCADTSGTIGSTCAAPASRPRYVGQTAYNLQNARPTQGQYGYTTAQLSRLPSGTWPCRRPQRADILSTAPHVSIVKLHFISLQPCPKAPRAPRLHLFAAAIGRRGTGGSLQARLRRAGVQQVRLLRAGTLWLLGC